MYRGTYADTCTSVDTCQTIDMCYMFLDAETLYSKASVNKYAIGGFAFWMILESPNPYITLKQRYFIKWPKCFLQYSPLES